MTGTVRKNKRSKHKWVLTIRFGYDSKTKKERRKEKSVEAATKAEAQQKLLQWMESLKYLDTDSLGLTLPMFAYEWLPKYAIRKKLAPRTVDSYEGLIARYIEPYFSTMKMVDITPLKIDEFINQLLTESKNNKQRRSQDKILSRLTVRSIYFLLNNILRYAYIWDKIPTNPMDKVEAPSGSPKQPKIFKLETIQEVFQALHQEPEFFQFMVLLDLTTGCREGELLGLSWNDYNPEAHTFYIHQTVQYSAKRGIYIFPHTKTPNSKRDIFVIPQLWGRLQEAYEEYTHIRKYAGNQWNPHHLVFTDENGNPIRPNYLSDLFTKFIRKHGIEHMRFHDLRGFFATQLMAKGYPLPDIIKKTGHSKASTLLDYYGHALIENKKAIDEAITTSFDELKQIPR